MKPFALRSRYYFSHLTAPEKKIYRKIYNCWVNGGSVAEVSIPGTGFRLPGGRELSNLVRFILEDNPNLFHLEVTHFRYIRTGDMVTIESKNVYTPEEYRAVYAKLVKKVRQIVLGARSLPTDFEKLRYLHDYLVGNIVYDRGKPDDRSQREIHTVVGALLNGACVCDGYARAFRLLCDHLRISCLVAIGKGTADGQPELHAWNFVRLEGQVYHVDVAWDSCYFAAGMPVTDHYFLRNDRVFSRDHSWDTGMYPPISRDYPRQEPLIADKWGMERYLRDVYRKGEREILLRFPEGFPGTKALETLTGDIIRRNPWVFWRVKQYSVVYYEQIRYGVVRFT